MASASGWPIGSAVAARISSAKSTPGENNEHGNETACQAPCPGDAGRQRALHSGPLGGHPGVCCNADARTERVVTALFALFDVFDPGPLLRRPWTSRSGTT